MAGPGIEPQAFPERIVPHESSGPKLGGECTLADVEREHYARARPQASNEEAARSSGIDTSTLMAQAGNSSRANDGGNDECRMMNDESGQRGKSRG